MRNDEDGGAIPFCIHVVITSSTNLSDVVQCNILDVYKAEHAKSCGSLRLTHSSIIVKTNGLHKHIYISVEAEFTKIPNRKNFS